MKNALKSLTVNACILLLLGHPLFLPAQTPGVPGGFAERYGGSYGVAGPSAAIDPTTGLPFPKLIDKNSPAWKKVVKEVNFDQVPMSEVIKWLREQFPEVNFVNAQEVEDVYVRLTLRSVTLDDIFTALNITSKGELMVNPLSDKMVSFFYQPLFPKQEDQKKYTRAYSLAGYLAGKSDKEIGNALNDLENALTISWEMLANANGGRMEKPALNVHGATKMLIVVGTLEQLEMVSQFVSQLQAFSQPRPPSVYAPGTLQIAPNPASAPAPSPSTNKPGSAK